MEQNYNSFDTFDEYGNYEVPIPTYVFDKKIDFRVLLYMIIVSNGNEEDEDRYLDLDKFNKDELCEQCGFSKQTLKLKLQYLETVGIIKKQNAWRGIVYRINYSKENKFFATRRMETLKKLYNELSNDELKVYFAILVHCNYVHKDKTVIPPLSNTRLTYRLGYSIKSKNNLHKIGKLTTSLSDKGYISKFQKKKHKIMPNGHVCISSTDTYYSIKTLETDIVK